MKKLEIRELYLERKSQLTSEEVSAFSKSIFTQFLAQFPLNQNQKIHCFLSIPEKNEVDTGLFLKAFFDIGIRVFVPKIFKGKLISVEIKKKTPLLKNFWGILEPESNEDSETKDFDYVITPLLYCDAQGNRVGYGKGFYDSFFSEIESNAQKIGVSFFPPKEKVDDIWENDIPLDYLVTPTEVLSFGSFAPKSTK